MSATTGAVVGSVVAMQAAQNERIEKQRCTLVVENYDAQHSTLAEMKDYSYCVQKLYPEPMSDAGNMVIKGCIVILLVSLVVGFILGVKESSRNFGDWTDILMMSILVPAITAIVLLVIGLVVMGVGFLFS